MVNTCQIMCFMPPHYSFDYDFDDICFLQVLRHSTYHSPISGQWRLPVTLPITFDHLGKIEVDFVTGAVLHQRDAIAVTDLAANRWNADRCLRTATNAFRPFGATPHLHPHTT